MPSKNDEKSQRKYAIQARLFKLRPTHVKKYGLDLGERGISDIRNTLNDLTGREWTYFTLSVLETKYPVSGPESYGHDLRRIHPSPKPPQLMAEFINFFTKYDEWVLDPFAGVGGTLIGCSITGRNAVGIELSNKYAEIYYKICEREGIKPQTMIVDDARNMDKHGEVISRKFKLILTDPPYSNMMTVEKSGDERKRGRGEATPFTLLKEDIGNLPYEDFLSELRRILEKAVQFLIEGGHLVVFCKDFQPTKKHHNMLHCDIVLELSKIDNLTFRGYRIWFDKTLNQYPFGYPYAFVATQVHQFALIFQKDKN
jgi:hypothetical protein